jgi:hypothetical protein
MTLRFDFTSDGRPARDPHQGDMSVTYVGRISRRQAEADARRRFEEWAQLTHPLARRRARDQLVLS